MAKQQSLMNLFYNIAYAIRSKTEKENLLTPEEFPEAIKSIETNDTEKLKEQLLNRTFSTITSNAVTIGSNAFVNCSQLTKISFPECEIIHDGAFTNTAITSAIFPKCISIKCSKDIPQTEQALGEIFGVYTPSFYQYGAFAWCPELKEISFPECTRIENFAFMGCPSLSSVYLPKVSYLGTYAFAGCSSLIKIDLPECTSLGKGAFSGCTNLTSFSLPKVKYNSSGIDWFRNTGIINLNWTYLKIPEGCFSGCKSLTTVNLPMTFRIDSYAFKDCYELKSFSSPVFSISAEVFANCYNLSSITLTQRAVISIFDSNVFKNTPYAGYSASFSGTPAIYVPSSYLASYKVDSIWSFFSQYLQPLND